MNFETIVKKQEEIEQLKRDKKSLIERLKESNKVIDHASSELHAKGLTDTDMYEDLCGELAPNEELLIKLESKT